MPFHVLTAEVSHETNSFSLQETDAQAFLNRYVLMGAEAVAERGARKYGTCWLPQSRSSTWLEGQSCTQCGCWAKRQGHAGNVRLAL